MYALCAIGFRGSEPNIVQILDFFRELFFSLCEMHHNPEISAAGGTIWPKEGFRNLNVKSSVS